MILVRPIKPGKPLQSSIFREEVTREANAIRKDLLDDFERTTKTWKHKVKFTGMVKVGSAAGGVSIEVSTKDKIYGYVDRGTRKHPIPKQPKRKGTLAWHPGSSPKTEPNVILSTPGSPGRGWRFAKQVQHPGTKARNFSKVIKQSYQKEFRNRMQNALDRFARRVK